MQNLTNKSDKYIVTYTRSINKQAYAQIIKRYQDKLFRYARYLVNDEEKALDIVQESFIKAYINLNSFNTKKKFSSWIYRIVHNQAINIIQKHKKELPLIDDIDFDSGIDVESDFSKKEVAYMLKKCLKQMPLSYREPITLYYLEERSYQEISDILQIPSNTVGTRISRAKTLMKKLCLNKI